MHIWHGWTGVSIAIALLVIAVFAVRYAFIVTREAPAGRDCAPHQPRHAASGQERMPSRDELQRWREDWTDAELAAMRAAVVAPAPSRQPWSFERWDRQREIWLEARRREAHEYALALKSGAWADPWWTRR